MSWWPTPASPHSPWITPGNHTCAELVSSKACNSLRTYSVREYVICDLNIHVPLLGLFIGCFFIWAVLIWFAGMLPSAIICSILDSSFFLSILLTGNTARMKTVAVRVWPNEKQFCYWHQIQWLTMCKSRLLLIMDFLPTYSNFQFHPRLLCLEVHCKPLLAYWFMSGRRYEKELKWKMRMLRKSPKFQGDLNGYSKLIHKHSSEKTVISSELNNFLSTV